MPRATARRVIKTDDDELEALNTVNDTMTLESLEATKEQVQVMIQRVCSIHLTYLLDSADMTCL